MWCALLIGSARNFIQLTVVQVAFEEGDCPRHTLCQYLLVGSLAKPLWELLAGMRLKLLGVQGLNSMQGRYIVMYMEMSAAHLYC